MMKKVLFAVVLGLLLVAAFSSLALADGGPHGRFNGATDACASCHRAHSAVSADGMLLVASDVYALCTSCHDGTGAITNVVDGYYEATTDPGHVADAWKGSLPTNSGTDGLGLFGGGFVNARMLTDYGHGAGAVAGSTNNSAGAWAVMNAYDVVTTSQPAGRTVTSAHQVGQTGAVLGTVWGSGTITATGTITNNWNADSLTLECTSCHNPHGGAGKNGGLPTGVPIASYRILDFTPVGSNGYEAPSTVLATTYWNMASTAGVSVPDIATKWYTPNSILTGDASVGAYRGGRGSAATNSDPEMYIAIFAGVGDYGGRYWAYQRPAVSSTVNSTRPVSCPNGAVGTGVPTYPETACGTVAGSVWNNNPAQNVMGFWCATCHDRYLAPGGASTTTLGGSRNTDSGDPGYHYRHRSQGVTTGSYATGGQYTCLSCHNAHGTAAVASALAGDASYAKGSVLLKADNRAICVRCHAAPVNFFNLTNTPTAIMVVPPQAP